MKVPARELLKMIDRWEHDKPLLVQWTERDEQMLSIAKEVIELREEVDRLNEFIDEIQEER